MHIQQVVKRKTIAITFSQKFEELLLNYQAPHISLSHDLETAAQNGLSRLNELEDVRDLKRVERIKDLIEKTNQLSNMSSSYFTQWHLNISEDLLDEIELLILTHGEDLIALGLKDSMPGTVLVLLATAELTATLH